MIACNFNGLRAIYTIWCACTAACTVACTVRALCVHCQNTRICILSPLLSFLLSLYTLLPPWRACVPVGTLLWALVLCRCMRPGKLVCPLEHSCEPWCFAAACALASLCARWNTLVSLGTLPLHAPWQACVPVGTLLWAWVLAAACALASLCARWDTLVSLGALPLLAPWRACVPVGTLLWAWVLCRCMRLGELVCPQLEHACEPGCFAAACALASLCARSWNMLVSLGALLCLPLLFAPWRACVPVGTLLWAWVLCRCLRLGELVCPQLEHACEPGCFAAACALASLCARSWNTLVSLGALPLPAPWRACVPSVGTCLWAWVLCRCLRLGELVCPQLEHSCEPWGCCPFLGENLGGTLVNLPQNLLAAQDGTFWLPKTDLPPTTWDITTLQGSWWNLGD